MTIKSLIITCSICLALGLIFFGYMQEIIIIRRPLFTTESVVTACTGKKEVTLSFWHHHKWHQEKKELLWHANTGTNIQNLINNLLTLLQEEQVTQTKASVQSVLITPSGRTAYVSFDLPPWAQEDTTYTKWLFIESILKTTRDTIEDLETIHFLINHTLCEDQHLDFSKAWPITGFYKQLQ
jgi:hypothetical protein